MTKLLPLFVLILALSAYSQTATIISKNASLLGTPSETGKVVDVLSQDLEVAVLRQNGAWFLVQTSDFVGWVDSKAIRIKGFVTNAADSSQITPVPSAGHQAPATSTASNTSTAKPTRILKGICGDGTRVYVEDRYSACVQHGYLQTWLNEEEAAYDARKPPSTPATTTVPSTSSRSTGSPEYPSSSGGTVNVKGYYRKDGTYVPSYSRSAPRRRP